MKPSRFWDFWYLYSAYHLEHHYFTGRPVLQPAAAPLRAAAVLRRDRLEAGDLRRLFRGLDLREQGAAHGLAPAASRAETRARSGDVRGRRFRRSFALGRHRGHQPADPRAQHGRPAGGRRPRRPTRLGRWLAELARARRQRSAARRRRARPRSAWTAPSRRCPEGPLSGEEIEDAVLPALLADARARYRARARSPTAPTSCAASAASASTCTASAGAPPRRSGPCRPKPPRLASLGLPPGVEALTRLPRGLVLVGGPTGSGKTTTLAALVEEINRRDARHIVTIEDPIEYEHSHRRSLVEQIEIGPDAPDFPTALRAALRQAPDVLVVGEMRDPETMRIALAAAETGHLVLSTVHTSDAASTVSRVADSFPAERQATIRQELSMALAAVLTQTLLPRQGRRPRRRRGAPDGLLRRAPAHPQERPPAPPPGDHADAHARAPRRSRSRSRASSGTASSRPRRRAPAPRTPRIRDVLAGGIFMRRAARPPGCRKAG